MKKILIINPFGIGDVLFTTPIIHTLKDSYPGLNLGYLCNQRTADILKSNPYVDFVFIYDRDEFEALRKLSFLDWMEKGLKFLNKIKEKHFDLALDFSLNSQFAFFSWYAGIKRRIGYDYKKRGRFLTQRINLVGFQEKHIIEYYACLLEFLGLSLKYHNLELYLKDEDIRWAQEFLNREIPGGSNFLVGIIPGAGRSWGRDAYFKHWPPEKFAKLADKLIENYHAQIIIMGDFSEKSICKTVLDNMRNKAIDFSGRTSLQELAAILSKLKLVITNDGGPLHMAVALGVNTVSIFGPVDELVYGPYPASGKHIVVSNKDINCRPCYKNFRLSSCASNRRCLEDITVEGVFRAATSLI